MTRHLALDNAIGTIPETVVPTIPRGYRASEIREVAMVHPLLGEDMPPYSLVVTNDGRSHYTTHGMTEWTDAIGNLRRREQKPWV